jgi:hypothetical protein
MNPAEVAGEVVVDLIDEHIDNFQNYPHMITVDWGWIML